MRMLIFSPRFTTRSKISMNELRRLCRRSSRRKSKVWMHRNDVQEEMMMNENILWILINFSLSQFRCCRQRISNRLHIFQQKITFWKIKQKTFYLSDIFDVLFVDSSHRNSTTENRVIAFIFKKNYNFIKFDFSTPNLSIKKIYFFSSI